MYIFIIAIAVFGLCFALDKGFAKLFRNKVQHKSGLAVHLNKRYALFGLVMAVLGLIGFVVGLIVVLILRGQLKSVRRQNLAGNYVRQNSMRLTHSSDLYLYSHVTRTRKETNRNSSGGSRGGGSRSIGGGRF
jgi:uncharacterized membrane protein YgcG